MPKSSSLWIATIDCTWKKLAPALARVEGPLPKLARIPADFVTAYPRKSKTPGLDPDGGLATIEALFIAAAFMGSWDESLLEKFHFKNQFLELNSALWKKYKLKP
jgi:pre-rRNA-processing protein TSR3